MADNGFTYWVNDDQLRTFASLAPERRLQWLEDMRELMYELATPVVRERWARLRHAK